MNKNGPIIIIEDDPDDQELFKEIFNILDYPNEVIFFSDGEQALDYLSQKDRHPFIIISDLNLPRINGMELRDKIKNNVNLALKCIPYLFFTTTANKEWVLEAYTSSVQGFFQKPSDVQELEATMRSIVDYWKKSLTPFSYA